MKHTHLKVPTIVLATVALVIGVSSGAVAGKLITGADVKDGSLTSKDIKNGTLVSKDMKAGTIKTDRLKDGAVTSKKIKDGTVSPNDLSQATKNSLKASYGETNWSVVDRNVQGNGDAFLRAGPTVGDAAPDIPPLGVGSLGIRTSGSSDKAAFGDQVDFAGMPFSDISALSYSIFTTGENFTAGGATNTPSISFELDFDPGAGVEFHTMFYQPAIGALGLNKWTTEDAVADPDPHWGIGGIGMSTLCDSNGTLCTWDDVQAYMAANAPDATILTVQITKGSGQASFSGAVDALQINDSVFDFEPSGVTESAVAAAKRH